MTEQMMSAGDLLCQAVDQWAEHGQACQLDDCRICDVTFNRLRLAHKVWKSSAHKAVSGAEVCICAAVQLPDGRVIRGHRHHDCFAAIGMLRTVDASIPSRSTLFPQGFVTSRNRFVGRDEGLILQQAAGIQSAAPGGYRGSILFSEDLYSVTAPSTKEG